MREEVEETVCSLKTGKSPGMDNIPSKLLKTGRRGNNHSPDSDTQEDLGEEGMAEGVFTIARQNFTKERQPQAKSEAVVPST